MSLEQTWYKRSPWLKLLRPAECLFRAIATRRRRQYQNGDKPVWNAPVPVIVVGNISVGGTGKSPLVIWLIEQLRRQGYNPGVVSRGYGAKPPQFPFAVTADSDVTQAGDEPLMIVRRTGVPMVIDPDRPAAARYLLEQSQCDLIISDDGLQHYALGRAIEIAVVDGQRGFGNRRCLPEGPLREPVERLAEVDFIVVNRTDEQSAELGLSPEMQADTFSMILVPAGFQSLEDGRVVPVSEWSQGPMLNAVAAIGNPERFYRTLRSLGFTLSSRSFPDHHQFVAADLDFSGDSALVMTEKDAVKCDHIQLDNAWFLQVAAQPDDGLEQRLVDRLQSLRSIADV
ncbi:MAG: tetraacyldisaccharide 4'-kinase [Amphritea sp.]|nr:tetraacyldisaccharide 4'-kinase [Amphritea sp.]